jgi:drug/metabolite transporter (DMT)-like permease
VTAPRDLTHDISRNEPRLSRPSLYALLVLVTLILGLNWPVMATGVESISPLWMGVFRVVGALIVIVAITASTGNLKMPVRSDLPIISSLAVFRLAAVFTLVFTGLQLVPPGRSSVIVWTASLWTVPLAAAFLGEKMIGKRWGGLLLGITGVVVLFEPWRLSWSDPGVILGHVFLILAAVTNAATSVHIRGHRWTMTPLQAVPWQLTGAAIILLSLALVTEGIPDIDWTVQLGWIVAYQGLLATGTAFWAQIVILRNLAAVSTNLTLMAVPVVGVVSSALLVGEEVTVPLVSGLVLIIVGVTLNLLADESTGMSAIAATEPESQS